MHLEVEVNAFGGGGKSVRWIELVYQVGHRIMRLDYIYEDVALFGNDEDAV